MRSNQTKTLFHMLPVLFALAFSTVSQKAFATHAAGADFTYRCLGGLQYELTLTFYRDCGGVAEPTSVDVQYRTLTGAYTTVKTMTLTKDATSGQEITSPCTSVVTKCNGGSYTGIRQWKYKGVVTLQGTATDWVFSYTLCCRNCAITTIQTPCTNNVSNLYVEATLNNVDGPANSSPTFTNVPIAFVYIGQNFNYNHGVIDSDGDSLAYSLITPRFNATTNVTWIAPHNTANPILSSTPFTINPLTGDLNFTPSQSEVGIMTVLVREYRNRKLIGSVIRDMQVYTSVSSNSLPTASGINGTNNYIMTACPQQQTCFNIYTDDIDSIQNVSISTNNGIPGATYTFVGGRRPHLHFCWTPQFSDISNLPKIFTLTVKDDACGLNGIQTYSYTIMIPAPWFSVSSTDVPCFGTSTGTASATPVYANPGYTWQWSNGATTQNITNVPAGIYTVTATDGASGCSATTSVTITQPSGINTTATTTNPSCAGVCNGAINTTSTGGSGYTYIWSNGATTEDISGLCAGTYTVTVGYNGSCAQSTSFILTNSYSVAASTTKTNVLCRGAATGSINLTVSNGVPAYTYLWSNGSTAQNPTGLAAGTYTVTATDANGCTAQSSATLTQPATIISCSISSNTTVSCYDGNNGSATGSASGGTPPYTYAWSNGASGATSSGLGAGNYTVTATDANGCTAQQNVTITQPAASLTTSLVPTNVLCFGNSTGSIVNTPAGGTSPYTYSWSTGATSKNLNSADAGTYTVTVTDNKGCTVSENATISQPLAALVTSTSAVNVLCRGNATGSITVNTTGGTTAYSYSWSNGATTATASGLVAGNYTVTVTDANNCTSSQASIIVTQPSAVLSVTQGATTHVTCNGLSNGSATATAAGGTSPYTYAWSNGATTATATGLAAGTYTVTVTDANNCLTINSSITITQPTILTTSISSNTAVTCFGLSNGSATVTASGGTSAYSYLWSNGATTSTAGSLAAGSYSVTVTDNKGCTSQQTTVITQPAAALSTSSAKTNVLCFGNATGAINLSVNGGTTAYTYNWSNGATAQNISALTSGTYTVTVTDANNCTTSSTHTITQPAVTLTQSGSVSSADCRGNATGSIALTANGGTSPYSYNWSNGMSAATAAPLTAGTYTVTVTDANSCSSTANYTVTQPAADLSYSVSTHTDVTCFGLSNGVAAVTATGGTGPYTYLWSNGATTASNSNLPAGTYTVTITDAHSCATSSASIIIDQPAAVLTASITGENVKCNAGNSGAATSVVSGGTSPYTYIWSTGSTASAISGLTTGTYTVSVTDAKGCKETANVNISQPSSPLSLSTTKTDINCLGNVIGSVDLTVGGGTSPYTYNWSNGSSQQDITNLTAGSYAVTVTDANGCSATTSATVTQPSGALSVSSVVTAVKCFGNATGAIDLTANAGTPPYTYQWNTGTTVADLTALSAGSYTVTITDANGCVLNNTLFVTQPSAALATSAVTANVLCFAGNTGSLDLTVTGGTTNYTYSWSNGSTSEDISTLTTGTYSVTVTDANSCTITSAFEVDEPSAALSATTSQTNLNCHDVDDGIIDLTVAGGTTPYTYLWSNGITIQDLSSLNAGNYSVTVTDANGCNINRNYEIIYTAATLAATSITNAVACNGDATGSINLQVNGGTGPFQFNWSNSATSEDLTNVASGTYSVIITDANGCTSVYNTGITQPPAALDVASFKSDEFCYDAHAALIDITVSGGTAPYTYNWNNGLSSEDLTGITSGSYSVTVTDNNGCTWTNSFIVSGPPAPVASTVASVDPGCFGDNTGSIDLTVSGGTPPYDISWSNGSTGQNISNVPSGIYIATITDANNCQLTQTVTLNQPAQPMSTNIQTVNIDCFSNSTGTITLTPSGGTAPYTYTWSNGATTDVNNQLASGDYNYTITDAQNCIINGAATVIQPANFLNANVNVSASLCHGDATGNIDLNISGGTPGYTFQWNTGATSEDLNNLTAGTYTVTVTDANNCIYTNSYIVDEPSATLAAIPGIVTNVNCFGNSTGSIDVNVTGGTSPYTYSWNTGANTSSLSQLSAGTYSLQVTDANGCTALSTVTLTEPTATLSSSGTVTAVDCHNAPTGSIDITVNGGTSPYTYAWNTGGTSEDLTQVEAGTYSVTVTDNQGCTTALTFTINEPQASLANTLTVQDINCTGIPTGSINTLVIGGTAPYTYSWSNGSTTASINSLTTGLYILTVTDAHGCSISDSATVGQPAAALSVSATGDNLNCTGDYSGAVTLTVSGGTGNYQYQWSNGATTMNITGVTAGTYSVTVTDINGCSSAQSIQITQPQQMLVVSSTVTNVSCFGQNNGSVTLNISGGDPAYVINWSNGSTTPSINNLSPGIYNVTVTDANGCIVNSSFNLSQPTASVNMNLTATGSNCLGGTAGTINTTVSGGTQPYQYSWNTGATAANLNNIYAGTYTVTVTDVNGCTALQSTTITDQSVLTLNTTGPVEICVGDRATLSATNIPGVQYQWLYNSTPLIGATSYMFSTPAAGTYILTATSACGTFTSAPIRVKTRTLTGVSISNNFIICPGEKVQLLAGGGTNYTWSPSNGLSNPSIPNPVAAPKNTTEYTVTITDDYGCKATATVTVSVLCDTLDVPNGFSPNGDGTNDYFVIDGLSQYPDNTLFIYNRWGNLVYKMREYDNSWNGTSNVSGIYMSKTLPNGTYYYILDLQNDQKPLNGFVVLKR